MQTKIWNKKGFFFSFVLVVALTLILALALTACSASNNDKKEIENKEVKDVAQPIAEGESLVIPISEISETVTFYPVTVDGIRMEVLVVKASDGTIRTAFNTCHVCNGAPYAYFEQEGNMLVCQNCGSLFPIDHVGIETGGCSPVPVFDAEKTKTDESITISYDTLQANAYWFPPNWKSE